MKTNCQFNCEVLVNIGSGDILIVQDLDLC